MMKEMTTFRHREFVEYAEDANCREVPWKRLELPSRLFDIAGRQHKFHVESASDMQTKHVRQPPPAVNVKNIYRVIVLFSDDSSETCFKVFHEC